MMRLSFVVVMMVASASSFAPSPKTQLASLRPAQAPSRVMPAMKLTPGNPMYFIGFPSQYQKDQESDKVCPYYCAHLHLWHAHRTELAPHPFRTHAFLPHALARICTSGTRTGLSSYLTPSARTPSTASFRMHLRASAPLARALD